MDVDNEHKNIVVTKMWTWKFKKKTLDSHILKKC